MAGVPSSLGGSLVGWLVGTEGEPPPHHRLPRFPGNRTAICLLAWTRSAKRWERLRCCFWEGPTCKKVEVLYGFFTCPWIPIDSVSQVNFGWVLFKFKLHLPFVLIACCRFLFQKLFKRSCCLRGLPDDLRSAAGRRAGLRMVAWLAGSQLNLHEDISVYIVVSNVILLIHIKK